MGFYRETSPNIELMDATEIYGHSLIKSSQASTY